MYIFLGHPILQRTLDIQYLGRGVCEDWEEKGRSWIKVPRKWRDWDLEGRPLKQWPLQVYLLPKLVCLVINWCTGTTRKSFKAFCFVRSLRGISYTCTSSSFLLISIKLLEVFNMLNQRTIFHMNPPRERKKKSHPQRIWYDSRILSCSRNCCIIFRSSILSWWSGRVTVLLWQAAHNEQVSKILNSVGDRPEGAGEKLNTSMGPK